MKDHPHKKVCLNISHYKSKHGDVYYIKIWRNKKYVVDARATTLKEALEIRNAWYLREENVTIAMSTVPHILEEDV